MRRHGQQEQELMFPVSSNLRTRRHQMKLGKSSFETKKGNPFFMAFGIRMGDSWPQSSGAAGDLCTCKKAMGHIQREELL